MGGWLVFFLLRFDHLNQSSMLVCRLKWDGRKKPSMIPSARVTTCIAGQLEMSYQFRPPTIQSIVHENIRIKKNFPCEIGSVPDGIYDRGADVVCIDLIDTQTRRSYDRHEYTCDRILGK